MRVGGYRGHTCLKALRSLRGHILVPNLASGSMSSSDLSSSVSHVMRKARVLGHGVGNPLFLGARLAEAYVLYNMGTKTFRI